MDINMKERTEEQIEPQSQWHVNWLSRFPEHLHSPTETVNDVDKAANWLQKASTLWLHKVTSVYLTERFKQLKEITSVGSVHKADLRLKNADLFLVDRELTKIEIMRNDCVFKTPVWMVDYSRSDCPLDERLLNHSADAVYLSSNRTKNTYLANCYATLDAISQELEKLFKTKPSGRREYDISLITKKIEKTKEHILLIEAGSNELDEYFLESDWDNCTTFPHQDNYIELFKYSASPLFLDTGDFLLFRKYKLAGCLFVFPYLKKVSYADFMRWAL